MIIEGAHKCTLIRNRRELHKCVTVQLPTLLPAFWTLYRVNVQNIRRQDGLETTEPPVETSRESAPESGR